jgi:Flp pilus assembly protein CpaB
MRAKVAGGGNRRLLVILAVALLAASVALLFSTYRSEPLKEFLVAKRDLPSGAQLTESDFEQVALDLDADAVYLSRLAPEATLASSVRKGELLPFSAMGSALVRHALVLTPSQPLSASIRVGSLVDVWFVARTPAADSASVPQRVATAVEVLAVVKPDANAAFGSEAMRLEVAVLPSDLAALMLASADGGFIGVVGNG